MAQIKTIIVYGVLKNGQGNLKKGELVNLGTHEFNSAVKELELRDLDPAFKFDTDKFQAVVLSSPELVIVHASHMTGHLDPYIGAGGLERMTNGS